MAEPFATTAPRALARRSRPAMEPRYAAASSSTRSLCFHPRMRSRSGRPCSFPMFGWRLGLGWVKVGTGRTGSRLASLLAHNPVPGWRSSLKRLKPGQALASSNQVASVCLFLLRGRISLPHTQSLLHFYVRQSRGQSIKKHRCVVWGCYVCWVPPPSRVTGGVEGMSLWQHAKSIRIT